MKRLWNMTREEPYRMFFPLAMLAGIAGVMLWPLWYTGHLPFYPPEAHARLMTEGFMGAFVLGFIGTAYPRLTGNHSWFGEEFVLLLGMWLFTAACHAAGNVHAGDRAFGALLVLLFTGLAWRWLIGNHDTPPPGFILALTGIAGASVAAGFLGWSRAPSPEAVLCARLFLFQGFLLLPVMGIGPYLLPRFFGLNSSHSFDDSPVPPPGWSRVAVRSIMAGLLIVASFALEVMGHPLPGQCLRALVVMVWFAMETPLLRRAKLSTTPGNAVRWALAGLVGGCVCAAIWPNARIGSLHLFFVSGLGLFTLAAGARVVLGHAGRHDLLNGKIIWLRWVLGLVVLAALTRMSADFLPKVKISHHIYAAWTWAIAALVWLTALSKYLLHKDAPENTQSKCPRRQGGS